MARMKSADKSSWQAFIYLFVPPFCAGQHGAVNDDPAGSWTRAPTFPFFLVLLALLLLPRCLAASLSRC